MRAALSPALPNLVARSACRLMPVGTIVSISKAFGSVDTSPVAQNINGGTANEALVSHARVKGSDRSRLQK